MVDAHLFLFPTPTTLPIKVAAHQTRAEIEAKARVHVETFIVESFCELPTPPPKVKMSGLYVLLFETYTFRSRTILEDPKETMCLLMKMETNGKLGSALVFAFGQWYLFPPLITIFVPRYLFS
jgi:hypothetical protein